MRPLPIRLWRRLTGWLGRQMPSGLLARALIIIIAPMVILQTVIGLAFMDRHWLSVTRRLSAAVSQDIAAVIDILDTYPQDNEFDQISRLALDRMLLDIDILPAAPLPAPAQRQFLSRFHDVFADQLKRRIDRFSFDAVRNHQHLFRQRFTGVGVGDDVVGQWVLHLNGVVVKGLDPLI